MFWRIPGLSTTSAVDTILDKENFTLEELLDEDEVIQECKAMNSRLINFLRERSQVEQLVRYIVDEAPEDADKRRSFKLPFIACEIFTCEVDILLKALVEDEKLMSLLFSFLEPTRSHTTLSAGCFSKVAICLLLRKTVPFMNYIQAHQDIIEKLVDLIGITSIMEVLLRLIGADEHLYTNYIESMQWIESIDVLEMVADKFSSSDCPEVHANAAEILCSVLRYAPPGIALKISKPSFVGRLFRHILEDSRPKSVLVSSLSVCISLLDTKRVAYGTNCTYSRQQNQGSPITVNPEILEGMLNRLGDLLKLLDITPEESVLLTPYGKLQPPLGKHRLKIIEFVSVLLNVGNEAVEKELICCGAIKRILDLFFEYPYNNFLHHHAEQIIVSCLESKTVSLTKHLLCECNLVARMLDADRNFTLAFDSGKPTVPVEGRSPPRVGNIGHITRISNRLTQLGNNNGDIQAHLQENGDWIDWQTNILVQRNVVENVYQWACGRPAAPQGQARDSDDDDYHDRDHDVAALANNLSQALRYGIYSNDDFDEAHGSLERDDEGGYFDDESAEVVISSLRFGDDRESGSLFTNSNWFAFEDERIVDELPAGPVASALPELEGSAISTGDIDESDDLADTASSNVSESKFISDDVALDRIKDVRETGLKNDNLPERIKRRETSDSVSCDATSDTVKPLEEVRFTVDSADETSASDESLSQVGVSTFPDREHQVRSSDLDSCGTDASDSSTSVLVGKDSRKDADGLPAAPDEGSVLNPSELPTLGADNHGTKTSDSLEVEKRVEPETPCRPADA